LTPQDLENLIQSDVNELYKSVGLASQAGVMGVEELSDDEAEELGRAWMRQHRARFAELLCGTLVIRIYLASPRVGDRVLLLAAIADLIIGIMSGIPPTTVAALLIKEGIDTLCKDTA